MTSGDRTLENLGQNSRNSVPERPAYPPGAFSPDRKLVLRARSDFGNRTKEPWLFILIASTMGGITF